MSPAFAAGPSGGTVSAGSATITQSAAQTTIKQTSDKAVVNWSNFSIGSGSTVRFVQPSASSIALNRVTGTQASVIQGALQANGQVWILNPNGVLIAPGGQVAAGSFLATTRSLTDQQFMAGNYAFTDGGVPSASVVNQGSIIVAEGGYAVLAGEAVRNEGYIEANLGQVVLGGAKAFTLDITGDNTLAFVVTAPVDVTPTDGKAIVDNSGSIQAAGGRVLMTARAASQVVGQVINTGGVVAATSAQMVNGKIVLDGGAGSVSVAGDLNASGKGAGQTGGAIDVNAQKIQVKATAKLDVTGDAGGGKIAIGGGGPNTRTQSFTPAESTTIAAGVRLDASALTRGDGGEILVFTSLTNPSAFTQVSGSLIARGGAQGGNGGFVETSGFRLDVSGIVVNTLAPKGRAGLWLLDPDDLVIANEAPDCSFGGLAASCTFLSVGVLNGNLEGGSFEAATKRDLTIKPGTGNIIWGEEITLTLTATEGSVTVGRPLSSTGGNLSINAGTQIKLNSNIDLGTGLATLIANTVTGANSTVTLGASLVAGNIVINGNGGSILLSPSGSVRGNNVTLNATTSGTSVTLSGPVTAKSLTVNAATLNLAGDLNLECSDDCGDNSLNALSVNVNGAMTQKGALTINASDPDAIAHAGAVNINSAYTVSAGGSLTIVTDNLSLNARLTVDGVRDLSLTANTQLNWNSDVQVDAGTSTIRADKIVWGGGGFASSNGPLNLSNSKGDAVIPIQFTSTDAVTLRAQTNLNVLSPLNWSGFTLSLLGGTVFLSSTLTGTAGASLFLTRDFGTSGGTNGPVTLDGTAALSSVFKVDGTDRGSTTSGIVRVTVTNPAGGGGGAGGGGEDTADTIAPVVATPTTTTAASTAAAKAAADAAAAKAIADAAAAKAATLDTTTKVVAEQAVTQAVATVVASTSAAVFVAPAPAPPAATATPSANSTTSTSSASTSSSTSTTTTASTTSATTTTTTAATTGASGAGQSTTVTQEFVEPLSVTTLSSTTSTVTDPGDTSAATTSTNTGPASQTAAPASTATSAPAAPSLTPVAVSKDGADAGDFTLQTVKPPAPVTTAKQEARPTERTTTTPVSPGIALQATQKVPAPSGSVLGREISGSGNSSNW